MTSSLSPTPLTSPSYDGLLRPVIAGAGAGILGGAGWALILHLTDYEVGWVAWGIGGLIGWAMSRATPQRSTELALIAAVIAILSLLIGKLLIQSFITRPAFEQTLRDEPEAVGAAAAWQLREKHAFPSEVQAGLDALSETDTLPDTLWTAMVAAGQSHADSLSEAERSDLASEYATVVAARVGVWEQLRWGFSFYDLLWFGLAVSTAWGMLKPRGNEAPATAT